MKCKDADMLINKYIDGEITEDEAVLLNSHLKECSPCKETFMLYDSLFADISEIQTPTVPENFENLVMSKIADLKPSAFDLSFKERVLSVLLVSFAILLSIGSLLIINRDAVMAFLYSNPSFSSLAEIYAPVVHSFTAHTAVIQSIVANILSVTNSAITNASGLIIGAMGVLCGVQYVLIRRHKKFKR